MIPLIPYSHYYRVGGPPKDIVGHTFPKQTWPYGFIGRPGWTSRAPGTAFIIRVEGLGFGLCKTTTIIPFLWFKCTKTGRYVQQRLKKGAVGRLLHVLVEGTFIGLHVILNLLGFVGLA